MSPEDKLIKAEELREKDELQEALKLNSEVIEEAQKLENWPLLCQAYQSRVLVYKHLFLLSKDKDYADNALEDAKTSVKIAEEKELDDKIGSANFRVGEIEMILENYEEAVARYKDAIDKFVGSNAERGDYTYHLGEATYKKGDEDEGREVMKAGLALIQANRGGVDSFLIHVWESGCYMRLAESYKDEDVNKAHEYLVEAKKIIEGDNGLVIRKRQLIELENKLK